jgi:hypothetical protein
MRDIYFKLLTRVTSRFKHHAHISTTRRGKRKWEIRTQTRHERQMCPHFPSGGCHPTRYWHKGTGFRECQSMLPSSSRPIKAKSLTMNIYLPTLQSCSIASWELGLVGSNCIINANAVGAKSSARRSMPSIHSM